jgi:hypothetical protein
LQARNFLVDTSPAWRLRRPDRYRGSHNLAVVERAAAHEYEMRTRVGRTEYMRAAGRAEFTVHHIAAIGNTAIVAQFSADRDGLARKTGVDRRAAGADVLTQTAPTHSRDDRRGADSIAHRRAQTPTGNFHDASLCQSNNCKPIAAALADTWRQRSLTGHAIVLRSCRRAATFRLLAPPTHRLSRLLPQPRTCRRRMGRDGFVSMAQNAQCYSQLPVCVVVVVTTMHESYRAAALVHPF